MNTKLNHVQNWLELAQKTNWSVSGLAKACGISVRALQLHFHKKFSMAPKVWLVQERQKQAIGLLSDGSCIKETAAQLGYKCAHHFSRDFKRHWGCCPTQIESSEQKLRI
jgi:AraC-like DNA-binding protein